MTKKEMLAKARDRVLHLLEHGETEFTQLKAAEIVIKHNAELSGEEPSGEERAETARAERRAQVLAANGRGTRKLGLVK